MSQQARQMDIEPSPNVYNVLPYPGAVHHWTHPDQLATKALLAGLEPAPVEQCRVLELGCGDGTNLTSMAFGLPHSQFTGIDLASGPLKGAVALAGELGLQNLDFRCADILDLGAELGEFDYITVPGLYSWVPEKVRDRLLALCRQCLAPNGVAIISYNVYPGAYPSTMVRDMMAYHIRAIADAPTRIRQARGLLHVLTRCQSEKTAYQMALAQEEKRIAKYEDGVFYHDDLSPNYHPVFFHQFAEHIAAHDLQYLGERCESVLDPDDYPAEIRGPLSRLQECGTVEREQYLDFIQRRRFRCSFLCREEVALDPHRGASRLTQLLVGLSRDLNINLVIDPVHGLRFENGGETMASTTHPLLVAAATHLLAVRPRAVPFPELLAAAQTRIGGSATTPENGAPLLEAFVRRCHLTRLLDLGMWQPHLEIKPSARPLASALARVKVRSGSLVPSLRHEDVALLDEPGRRLLGLLDGSRDRAQLLHEFNAASTSPSPDAPPLVTAEMLEEKLVHLAQLALLSA